MEIKEIPPHVALPQVTAKHVESYVRRLRRRQKLLSRLASVQASKAQDESEHSFLTPSSRGLFSCLLMNQTYCFIEYFATYLFFIIVIVFVCIKCWNSIFVTFITYTLLLIDYILYYLTKVLMKFPLTDQLPQEGIPNIFLSSTFNLEDPETFFSVFTHVSSSGVSVKNAKILQEKVCT